MPDPNTRTITFTWNWKTVVQFAAIGVLEAAMWTLMESFPRWFVLMTVAIAILFILSLNAEVKWRGFRFVPWGLGILYFGMLGYATFTGKSKPTETAHISAQLVIEAIKEEGAVFRFDLENIGGVGVDNLRCTYSTSHMTSSEPILIIPRKLPAHGRLSIQGMPIDELSRQGALFLDLNYEIDSLGQFTSQYRFVVNEWKPQSIFPDEWEEHAGDVTARQSIKDIATIFSGPQGSIYLTLPERNKDGTPNLVLRSNSRRKFLFDPLHKTASLSSVASSGRSVTVSGPLGTPVNGFHIIFFSWDEKKAHLLIDGASFTEEIK